MDPKDLSPAPEHKSSSREGSAPSSDAGDEHVGDKAAHKMLFPGPQPGWWKPPPLQSEQSVKEQQEKKPSGYFLSCFSFRSSSSCFWF